MINESVGLMFLGTFPSNKWRRFSTQGVQPGEKVVVGGLGVKIGAIGKVTEIGMKVKTEENHQPPVPQKTLKAKSSSEAKTKSSSEAKTEKPVADPVVSIKEVKATKEKVSSAPLIEQTAPPVPVETAPAKETPAVEEKPKLDEIQVILDTGDSELKVASMLVGPSPPKDPPPTCPPVRPTTLTEIVPSSAKSTKPIERVASPPPKAIRVASPPPKAIRVASPPPRPLRVVSPLPARIASPPPTTTVLPPVAPNNKQVSVAVSVRAISPPPLRPLSPPSRPLSPPASLSRPMSPVYVSAELPSDRTEDDCIAGSENAFIRGIRSPTRDHPPAITTTLKRFSKGPGELPSAAAVADAVSEPKPIQKAEINIPVSVTSLSATPRERIIPIRVEGRELQPLQPIPPVPTTVGLAGTEGTKTLPKSLNSISVQLRATPPRVTSPPPIKPLAIRPP